MNVLTLNIKTNKTLPVGYRFINLEVSNNDAKLHVINIDKILSKGKGKLTLFINGDDVVLTSKNKSTNFNGIFEDIILENGTMLFINIVSDTTCRVWGVNKNRAVELKPVK